MAEEGGTGLPAAANSHGSGQDPSRRSVLRGAAGLAGAGMVAGAVAVAPAVAAAAATQRRGQPPRAGSALDEPVVVHLKDAASGEMEVFAGTRQARLHDPDLAARLVRAIR
jgi:hypothetical protein